MKKQEVTRVFKFADALLITKGKEKIAFMRRDVSEFTNFGITATQITELENSLNTFSETVTDIEALSDQVQLTAIKDAKAEKLRVAIRSLMMRVELQFGTTTASYRKFGTENLAK